MGKELEKKMTSIQKKAIKELGEKSDVLVASFNDGHCGCIIHGASQNIAHSLFALIHDPKGEIGTDLYHIIKLVVLNIVNNESPYAMDLLTSILNSTKTTEQSDKPENGKKAVLIQMPKKNEQD